MSDDVTYAIDFGTSNSLLAAASFKGAVAPIPLDPSASLVGSDPTILRSLMYFANRDSVFYGAEAISQFSENEMSGRLFRSFKSHLRSKSYLGTMIENRPMPLEQMVGIFLLQMKQRADKHFGRESVSVVLGRPARYSMDVEEDRFAEYRMRKAAEFAGFKNIEFLPEPIAAAYEFRRAMDVTSRDEKVVLVVDLGGGTSDFTVVKLSAKEFKTRDVLAVGGVPIAGDAFDSQVMTKKVAPYFGSEVHYRIPMSNNILQMPPAVMQNLTHPSFIAHLKDRDTYDFLEKVRSWALRDKDKEALQRLFVLVDDNQAFSLFETIDKAKRALSSAAQTAVAFDYPDIEISVPVTAFEFNEVIADRAARILGEMDETLKSAGLTPADIDLVCCTGGTSKVPLIQRELEARFGPEKMRTRDSFNSVVQGLSERALELAKA